MSVVLVLSLIWRQEREYRRASYHGKNARAWAEDLAGNFNQGGTNEAQTAFRVLGASAVPTLRALLKSSPPFYEKTFLRLARYLPPAPRRYLFEHLRPGRASALRIGATRGLGLIGPAAESAVPDLIAALGQDDTRWAAAQSLAQMGRGAIPALIEAAQNQDSEVRHSAVYALGEAGTNAAPATAVLLGRVSDTNKSIHASALYSLSRVGTAAMPVVLETFATDDTTRKEAAGRALRAMNSSPHSLLQTLLDYSTNASPALREHTLEALQALAIHHPRVVAAYVSALNDPAPDVRAAAARALSQLPRWSTNTVFCATTVRLLGQTGSLDSNVVFSLTALLKDPAPTVRRSAEQTLASLRTPTTN